MASLSTERVAWCAPAPTVVHSGTRVLAECVSSFVGGCHGCRYRFNGDDGRLDRSLETATMFMEALQGFERKISYSMVGHSGDGACIPLVARRRGWQSHDVNGGREGGGHGLLLHMRGTLQEVLRVRLVAV